MFWFLFTSVCVGGLSTIHVKMYGDICSMMMARLWNVSKDDSASWGMTYRMMTLVVTYQGKMAHHKWCRIWRSRVMGWFITCVGHVTLVVMVYGHLWVWGHLKALRRKKLRISPRLGDIPKNLVDIRKNFVKSWVWLFILFYFSKSFTISGILYFFFFIFELLFFVKENALFF